MSVVFRSSPVHPVAYSPSRNSVRWAVGIIGLLSLLWAFLFLSDYIADPVRFPVLNVDVGGTLDYTDRDALRERVEQHTGLGFYGLDVDDIQASIATMPWVAQAHIRRMWPGRLLVEVEEHEPAARYNDNALISKRLVVFQPPQLLKDNAQYLEWQKNFASLPKLSGAEGRHEAVLDDYRLYSNLLAPFGAQISALHEDKRRSQTLELTNNITVRLGYEAHELRLQRFLDVYERLVTPLDGQAARFDMRYSNGFAMSGASTNAGSY